MAKKFLLGFMILIIIGVIFLCWLVQSKYIQRMIYPLRYQEEIIGFSREYELDPHMVMSIIWVESKFKPEAQSGKDAKGLMQIIPKTGKWIAEQLGFEEYEEAMLYEPVTNIRFGSWYFAYLIRVFDNEVELALAAYNGGMGNVRKWLQDEKCSDDGKHLKHIPIKETSDYLERVKDAYRRYKNLYEI